MITAEARGDRFYCGRSGCHTELEGLQAIGGDRLRPSGRWDLVETDGITVLMQRRATVGRRRLARRASRAVNDPPKVGLVVALPVVVECPQCHGRQEIGIAPPSD